MRRRLTILAVAFFAISTSVIAPGASAQRSNGLVDGYTFGIGLALYQGDLDRNPSNGVGKLLTMGNLQLMAGVDRDISAGRLGVELHYNRVVGINAFVTGDHNVVSLDLTFGRRLGRSPVRAFVGLAPTVVFSSYESLTPTAESFGFVNRGTGFDLTLPIGVSIQDRVRLSTRVALFDGVDGTDNIGGKDVLSNISIVYRFGIR
ncbi:MAG: hypothetical protein KJO98_16930 [Rhodothermia bacterium]|nr:hypothetical protein [Rhodothermia bacterium]